MNRRTTKIAGVVGSSLFVWLPTYDEKCADGFDEENCVPVRVDDASGGLQVALLSARDENGEHRDVDSPEVYIERRRKGWCILISRLGGGEGDLMVTIPDIDDPIVAEPAAWRAPVQWRPYGPTVW